MDDVGLLDRARKGDAAAFSQLFARHQRAVFRYAAYMCGREAGEDVVQETFLAVLRQGGRDDRPQGTVSAYLIGIARHLALKRLASRQEAAFVEEVDDDASAAERGGAALAAAAAMAAAAASGQGSALDELTRTETIDAVRAAVQSLPAAYREVIVLCELEEMDYAVAADVLRCPIGTVRSRLHRARALLLTKLTATQTVGGTRR
jgi:RNA polymerase sigma-70 factor (ECF subfamily)